MTRGRAQPGLLSDQFPYPPSEGATVQKYEFTKSVTVDGTPYRAGDQVTEDQVPGGCFASLTRLRHLVEVAAPVDPAVAFANAMSAGVSGETPDVHLEVESPAPVEPVPAPPAPAELLVGPPGAPAETKPEPPRTRRK